jgi:hypothetical protein
MSTQDLTRLKRMHGMRFGRRKGKEIESETTTRLVTWRCDHVIALTRRVELGWEGDMVEMGLAVRDECGGGAWWRCGQ